MNWHIGQEVVCVKPNPTGELKKDSVYTIRGIVPCICNCMGLQIDIGMFHSSPFKLICPHCNYDGKRNESGYLYFHERAFLPLDELADISELTEILETTKPFDVLIPEQNSQE